MCSTFKKHGICQLGINCPKKHDYKDKDVNLSLALNVILGCNSKLMSEVEKINVRLDKIEVDLNEIRNKTQDNKIVSSKLKSIDEKMENVIKSSQSGGLPLKSYVTAFQAANTAFPNLPSVADHTFQRDLNKRAIDSSSTPIIGREIPKSDSSSSGKVESIGNSSVEEDIVEQHSFDIYPTVNLESMKFENDSDNQNTPQNSPRNSSFEPKLGFSLSPSKLDKPLSTKNENLGDLSLSRFGRMFGNVMSVARSTAKTSLVSDDERDPHGEKKCSPSGRKISI